MAHFVEINFPESKTETKGPRSFVDLPVWACGFRPFFLGGALAAASLIAAWLIVFIGKVRVGGLAGPVGWHSHEMVFGFTTAIIAGFLLTAVPKWTRTRTLEGAPLAAIFGLWALGRIAMVLAGVLPYAVAAVADFLFLPALAFAISRPIIAARTPRNFGFVPLLSGLAVANALFHLGNMGVMNTSALGLNAGIAIIIVIIAVIGGRVIPFFTVNRLGLAAPNRHRPVDIATLITTVAWGFSFAIFPFATWTGVLAIIAGVVNLGRMYSWASFKTAKVPLLWVLHVGYGFIGLGLILLGLANLEIMATRAASLHALTAGGIGVLCLGMMARVSLGHSGRALKAHTITAIAFGLITLAALSRVFGPLIFPAFYLEGLVLSGTLWTIAWVLFLVIYSPILLKPRADGRPG